MIFLILTIILSVIIFIAILNAGIEIINETISTRTLFNNKEEVCVEIIPFSVHRTIKH